MVEDETASGGFMSSPHEFWKEIDQELEAVGVRTDDADLHADFRAMMACQVLTERQPDKWRGYRSTIGSRRPQAFADWLSIHQSGAVLREWIKQSRLIDYELLSVDPNSVDAVLELLEHAALDLAADDDKAAGIELGDFAEHAALARLALYAVGRLPKGLVARFILSAPVVAKFVLASEVEA